MMDENTPVTMVFFCDHKETRPLKDWGVLHDSVHIRKDGTCNRLRWCPACTEAKTPKAEGN